MLIYTCHKALVLRTIHFWYTSSFPLFSWQLVSVCIDSDIVFKNIQTVATWTAKPATVRSMGEKIGFRGVAGNPRSADFRLTLTRSTHRNLQSHTLKSLDIHTHLGRAGYARDMFSIIDTAIGTGQRPKTGAERACDQCKLRKVRCDMGKPCVTCSAKGFDCSYDVARKKRGPAGKRISEIRRRQSNNSSNDGGTDDGLQRHPSATSQVTSGGSETATPEYTDSIMTATPEDNGMLEQQQASIDQQQASLQQQQASIDQQHAATTYWASNTSGAIHRNSASSYPTYPDLLTPPANGPTSTAILGNGITSSPNFSDFVFPSMPVDSPSGAFDAFGAIPQQDLPPIAENTDIWPSSINEETLLPWIDVYFKRLHPTVPILNRTNMYHEMLLRKHRADSQYGAMLLGLCAFAMTQPVQIHERAAGPSRSAQAGMLLEKCVKMRVMADFGEDPTMEMILTSFFLFACLFGNNKHKAARHRLREAVDLAYSLGIHLPESYEGLSVEKREQWLRTYLVLSVTERAYALQQRHSIDFRGRPGITARFMQAFDPTSATEYIARLLQPREQSDAAEMTGLLYLMETFDAIDESVIDCWNGFCRYSDGACETFDRRRALQAFQAQHRAREACLTGNISFAPTATPLPLDQVIDSQQADISVTQFWLLNRLWTLCLSHGLLREISDHPEIRFDFACQIARVLSITCNNLSLAAMEVHGVGLVEKVFDVTMGVITAMNSSPNIMLDKKLQHIDADVLLVSDRTILAGVEPTIRQLLYQLSTLIRELRGGDHQYSARITSALNMIPGWEMGQG